VPSFYVADDEWKGVAHAHTRTLEASYGRIEQRDYWLITEPEYLRFLNPQNAWREVGAIGMVVRQRTMAELTSQEIGYYLLSGTPTVERFATAVRGQLRPDGSLAFQ
jgi:hypothetical protein